MSNYVKSTNFASKDSLAIGDPLKIVKGTEIDTEFNNIATAVATKADLNSPTFIGTPAAPTASAGTSTTQLATTAFVTSALQAVYPVGSIYINAGVTTNPGTLLGFGTWVEFGAGRVLVGQNTSDTLFDTLEETGGSKDAIVVSHNHTGTTDTNGSHSHNTQFGYSNDHDYFGNGVSSFTVNGQGVTQNPYSYSSDSSGSHNHGFTTSTSGSSGTNANVQPFIVVKMWKRTA
jgi:hypothetical protein